MTTEPYNAEVHNVGERLDLETLPGEQTVPAPESSSMVWAGGQLLLWVIAAVVFYSATL